MRITSLVVQVEQAVFVPERKTFTSVQTDVAVATSETNRLDGIVLDHGAGAEQIVDLRRLKGLSKSEHARTVVGIEGSKEPGAGSVDL